MFASLGLNLAFISRSFIDEPIIEQDIQDFCSVWFIVSGQSCVEFSPVSSASLKISSRLSTLGTRSKPNFWRLPVSELTRPRLFLSSGDNPRRFALTL